MANDLVKVFDGKPVHAREGDHYVNATELAKAAGKSWPHYRENKGTQEFLETLAGSIGIPMDLLTQTVKVGPNESRGTWVHPRVVIHFAQWASPQFAVAVSGWVLELITTGKVELNAAPVEDVRELVRAAVAEAVPALLASAIQASPRLSGPFWTVESRLEELYPHWNTTAAQRHRVGQLAKKRVNQILNEPVSYFNRDLAFTAHQVYYLDRAAEHVYRSAARAGEAQGFGLFEGVA